MDRLQVPLLPDPPPGTGRVLPRPLPPAPVTPQETGLSLRFLVELVAKLMLQHGLTRLTDLGAHLGLSATVVEPVCQFMRAESLLEVARRGE